jgi:hypothetical protein
MFEQYEYTVEVTKKGSFTIVASSLEEARQKVADMDDYELDHAATWEDGAEYDGII